MGRIIRGGLLVITLAFCAWYYMTYGKESYPFHGDSMGYYMYLPSTFIYHNHKALDWLPPDKKFDHTVRNYLAAMRQEGAWTPKGYLIDKYTYGVAALELPFFFIAHAYEKMIGGEASGYSASYRHMLKISSLVYALLGLLLVYRILQRFFGSTLAVAGTVLTLMGTNLFWFALHQAGMAHVPLFMLYALLIYVTILLHDRPRMVLFIIAGLTAGLITIIRPTDIICLLIPMLYNVYNRDTLRQKIAFIRQHIRDVIVFAAVFILPILPQMIYWKMLAGSFVYYSYTKETFNWAHPEIINGLFSYHNGWLTYSPLMLFGLAGMFCYRKIRPVAVTMYIMIPVYIYVVYSWYCWNYINGLGSRPMLHMYPLLAISLTALLQYVWQRKVYVKATVLLLVLFCVSINISYSLLQARGILYSEESNRTCNTNMLFKINATYNDLVMCDVEEKQPESNDIERVASLVCRHHEDSVGPNYAADPTGKSRNVYYMSASEEFYKETIRLNISRQQLSGARWFRCSGRFYCTQHFSYFKHMFTFEIRNGDKTTLWKSCKIDNKIGLRDGGMDKSEYVLTHMLLNTWSPVSFYVRVPEDLSEKDEILLHVWNIAHQEIYFDDICLELWRERK